MRIAVAQINTVFGDLDGTLDRMLAQARLAEERQCDLLVFPVPTLCGFGAKSLAESEWLLYDIDGIVEQYARKASVTTLLPTMGPYYEMPDPEVLLIHEGMVVPYGSLRQRASELMGGYLGGESHPITFEIGSVSVAVCTELDELYAVNADEEARRSDIAIYLSMEPFCSEDAPSAMGATLEEGTFADIATQSNAWLVGVAGIGGYDDVVFTGGSFVLAPWGEVAQVAPSFEEALMVYDVDLMAEGPLGRGRRPTSESRGELIWRTVALGLRDYVLKQGLEGVRLVMDGGVQSAALATVAVDALGPTRVTAYLRPHLSRAAAGDARRLAGNLGIQLEEADGAQLSAMDAALGADDEATRTLVTHFLAHGGEGELAISALDKTGLYVGQDPDACRVCDLAPLADVYRSELLDCLSRRNALSPVVPPATLKRVSIPKGFHLMHDFSGHEVRLSYLDGAIYLMVEQGYGYADMSEAKLEPFPFFALRDRVDATEAFRRRAPLGLCVSGRAAVERPMPLPNAWHDRMRWPEELADPVAADEGEDDLYPEEGDESVPGELPEEGAELLEVLRQLYRNTFGGGDGDIWAQGLFSDN